MRSERVMDVRGVVVWVARAIGVAMVGAGVFVVLDRALPAVYMWRWDVAWASLKESQDGVRALPRATALWALGLALAAGSRAIARWVVVTPRQECPRCGYATGPDDVRCSECGYGTGK